MSLKGMRVKPQTGMHYGNNRVEFDSPKNRCRITAQSLLEFMEYMRLELSPNVASYTPHPGFLIIQDDEKGEARSIFDAEVHMTDGRIIYEEIKYIDEVLNGTDADDPYRSKRQINVQQEWCIQHGYEYSLVTDEDLIRNCPAMFNNCVYIVQRLRPERINDINMLRAKVASVYSQIADMGGKAVISKLAADLDDVDEVEELLTAVCYLIKEGRIETDLEVKPLDLGSEVRISAEA